MTATNTIQNLKGFSKTGSASAVDTNLIEGTLDSFRYISVEISGTFAATVEIQTSNNGTSWFSQEVTDISNNKSTNITTAGFYELNLKGAFFRIRVTAYTSGTVQADAFFYDSEVTVGMASTAGGATAANQVEQIANFGDITDTPATDNTGSFSLLAFVKRLLDNTLAKGQALAANSFSFVLASDSAPLPTIKDTIVATPQTLTTATTGNAIAVDGAEYIVFRAALTSVGASVVFSLEGSNDNETTYDDIGEELTWFTNQSKKFLVPVSGLTHVRPNLKTINGGTPSLATQISYA